MRTRFQWLSLSHRCGAATMICYVSSMKWCQRRRHAAHNWCVSEEVSLHRSCGSWYTYRGVAAFFTHQAMFYSGYGCRSARIGVHRGQYERDPRRTNKNIRMARKTRLCKTSHKKWDWKVPYIIVFFLLYVEMLLLRRRFKHYTTVAERHNEEKWPSYSTLNMTGNSQAAGRSLSLHHKSSVFRWLVTFVMHLFCCQIVAVKRQMY